MEYYVDGRYYRSELEAIEAMSRNLNELAHYISESPVKLGPGHIYVYGHCSGITPLYNADGTLQIYEGE